MVLKRKRSDSEISTSSSLLSSPLGGSNFMAIDSFQSHQGQNQIASPTLFSSRTRKRHRDNRPSESDVHQHTLSLLFSAQQNMQPPSQSPQVLFEPQAPVAAVPASNSQSGHQSSLHSFWALPSSARQSSPSNTSTSSRNTPVTMFAQSSYLEPTNCEGCDTPLNHGDNLDSMDMDVMMDIDTHNGSGPNYACATCLRQVCHSCAVSNLGAQRKCLMCAGPKKKWVGGIGWMDVD